MRRVAFDIETSPMLSAIWSLYQDAINPQGLLQYSYILCWSALDIDTGEFFGDSLHLHKRAFKKDPTDDSLVTASLWRLFDEADVLLAHNGDRFDIPVANTRFLAHGMPAPSSYKSMDTLKIFKSKFKLPSNRLNEIAKFLRIGEKEKVEFDDWMGCMSGRTSSFEKMFHYNRVDTELLLEVYRRVMSYYLHNHHVGLLKGVDDEISCPACGGIDYQLRGFYYTKAAKRQRYMCNACHSSFSSTYALHKTRTR